ncbi:MAG: c-type cytochrome biogenesis protein CcmI [Paracoccaceae bacterium]
METGAFWIAAACMALAVLGVLVQALRQGPVSTGSADLRVYRDQLAEIDRDLARGTLAEDEAQRLRVEVQRRVLASDRAEGVARRGSIAVPVGVTVLALAGAVGVYQWLGVPGYPDLPLATRHALSDEVYVNRPTQDQAEAMAPARPLPEIEPEFAGLMDKLRAAVVSRPDDIRGLELLARNEAALGDYVAARMAQGALIAAKGEAALAEDHAVLAEMMILAAGGVVTPEAEQALIAALRIDPKNGTARYYSGLMFAQIGRTDRTFAMWRPLLDESAPGDPWVAPIRARIEEVARSAGIRFALPNVGVGEVEAPGPSAGDVAASADMTPEERQAMIQGMVSGLAERLASDGGPATDWARLITSLAVLGETDRAREILVEAEGVFAGSADASVITEAARAAGLTP